MGSLCMTEKSTFDSVPQEGLENILFINMLRNLLKRGIQQWSSLVLLRPGIVGDAVTGLGSTVAMGV